MSPRLLALYTHLEVWLFLASPRFLWQAVQQLRVFMLRSMESSMYAPLTDRVGRLCDASALIISGSATTEQVLAVLLVIAVHTAYVGLLMKPVHRRATIRPDTQ